MEIVSLYDQNTPFPVYCNECWHSDKWDPLAYGREYDFKQSFFEQNQKLRLRVPRAALIGRDNVNSSYINIGAQNKNCYFLIESSTNENSAYGYWLEDHCREVLDSAFLRKVEVAYESQSSWESFKLLFSKDCRSCLESAFLMDCVNTSHCFGCVNLRNKSYRFFNQPCAKDEFSSQLNSIDLGSYLNLSNLKQRYRDFAMEYPRRFAYVTRSTNCSGDYIINSNNCRNSFFVEDGDNVKYGVRVMYNVKDIFDCDTVGAGGELCYESINTAIGVYNMKFCIRCWSGKDSDYCDNCDDINSCFGCIGIRHKGYCILNRQYQKREYEKLLPRIVEQMNNLPFADSLGKAYRYGEFFPPELSPFAYNETIASEYFPLTEETAVKSGLRWKSIKRKKHEATLKTDNIPDHIRDINDSILSEVIECAHRGECDEQCSSAFRIVSQELTFYRKMNLPLPRLCPNCRHYGRQRQRNPLTLWRRQCTCGGVQSENGAYKNAVPHSHGQDHCSNEFETSYSPGRPEIVYCEECYKTEVA